MPINCPKCNYRNVETDAVCGLCGELLKAKKQVPPQEKDAFLICFPYKPIKLVKGTTYTLGREKDNDFVLPGQVVSRKHARISGKTAGFTIADLGSANGTVVNGEKIPAEQELKAGDNIRIGNYDLQFRLVPKGVSHSELEEDESAGKTLVMSFGSAGDGASAFAGKLSELGLSQILQILSMEGKTGRLKLDFDGKPGTISLLKGNVVHATLGKEEGLQPFYKMCRFTEGSFAFESDKQPEAQTISGATHALLLEAFRQQDEESQSDGATRVQEQS